MTYSLYCPEFDARVGQATRSRDGGPKHLPVTEQIAIDFSGPATKWLAAQTETLKKIREAKCG